MLKVGDKAPEFSAPDQNGTVRKLKDFKGTKLVLYFYPKDMTSGCTREACDFRDRLSRLAASGAQVVGVSPDSVARHKKFETRESLNFPLLSDEDRAICEAYGVWVEKSLYGRTYMGVERATFVIDAKGRLTAVFRKVKVPGHVDAVLDALAD